MVGVYRSRIKIVLLISIFGIAILCYLLKHTIHYSPFWINVLNDIIAIPVLLYTMTFLMRKLYGQSFQLSFLVSVLSALLIGILFELVFPILSTTATSDGLDFVWYFIGLGLYWSVFKESVFQHRGNEGAEASQR